MLQVRTNGASPDEIHFNISGTGVQRISLVSTALPDISDTVILDATTQTGYAGIPLVEIDGSAVNGNGLTILNSADDTTIRGFVIGGFSGDGIQVYSDDNLIELNYVGTTSTGLLANANSRGIEIDGGRNNQVLNNLISGNNAHGVYIHESSGTASGNTLQGNLIGTTANGSNDLGNALDGVRVESSGNTIGGNGVGQGNTISGNDNNGLVLSGSSANGNFVRGNRIGVSTSGTVDIGNLLSGLLIENGASTNVIGDSGTTDGMNVISGNNQFGVVIKDTGTSGNSLYGNHIGVDLVGSSDLGNTQGGVKIETGAANNHIGRLSASTHNVISGNDSTGVLIKDVGTNGNTVEGNYIGVNFDATNSLPNTGDGISISAGAQNSLIGGTVALARNVISANSGVGISIINTNTTGNVVQGNYIGVNGAATATLGNSSDGVRILDSGNNTIGGSATGAGNLIAANASDGIQIASAGSIGNVVEGNLIGTNSSGDNLGNADSGIRFTTGANQNTVGGTGSGEGNVIAFNSLQGIVLETSAGTGNKLRANLIHSNNGLGIDLGNDGVTTNDIGDSDSGPNSLQNRPTLTGVSSAGGDTTITGTLHSTASMTFNLDYYSSPSGDASGSGEGRVYLGSGAVVTDGSGEATINETLTGVTVTVGHAVSATATDQAGNTSEFAINVTSAAAAPQLDLDANNSSGATGNDYRTTFNENSGGVLIADTDAMVSDPDSLTLSSATITITNLSDVSFEILTADVTGTSIVANYNFNSGELSLTGTASTAHYQQVLRTVSYNHTSDAPTDGQRLVTFEASDGANTSVAATASVTVNATNDPPAILAPASRTTIVDNPVVFGTANGNALSVTDPDAGTGAIEVMIDAIDGTFTLSGTSGLTFSSGDGTADTSMVFTGSLADVNDALDGSQFASTMSFIGTAQLQLVVDDQGNTGGSGKSDSHDIDINVTSVADLAAVPESLVNADQTVSGQATSNEQRGSSRAIATAQDGSYVVVWTGDDGANSGVYGQRYNRFGEALGNNFAINEATSGHQRWVSVDTDSNGNFVATWVSENQDGTPRSVFARRFATDGTALGSEFRVNTHNTGSQDNASVAVDANGDFVVVWEGDGAGGYDIYGRRFDSTGAALGLEFQVSTTSPDGEPVVAIADDGRFVVVWDDNNGIRAHLYDANGSSVTGEFLAHAETFAGESSVAMDADGDFAVVWRETNGGKNVYFRLFDSNGTPVSSATQLNTTTSNTQTNPSVAVDAAGNFVAVWEGRGPGDTDGVFYRRFTSAGLALDASEVLVNQTTGGTQDQASVAVQNVDNFAVVWTGNGPGDFDGVFVRQFGTANRPPINVVPGAQSVDEDGTLSLNSGSGNQLSILDTDVAGGQLSVTLAVTNGVVSLGSTSGLTFTQGDGTNDATQQFEGELADINAAIANVAYTPTGDFNGNASLTITTDDLGNTGTGGPQVDVDVIAITVDAVNDPPTNAVPGAQNINEDTTLVFSAANSNAIVVSDVDAGVDTIDVTLSVLQGSLTLSGTSGLLFTSGDGTDDVTMTFKGTLANINTALEGLAYTPSQDYAGTDQLTIETNDLGSSGSGGSMIASNLVAITINPVNDAPIAVNDSGYVVTEDEMLSVNAAAGVLVNDTDPDGPSLQAVLVATTTNGILTLNTNGSFDYTPTTDFFGTDTFTYQATDGLLDSSVATATITVTNVNDAPVATDNAYSISEDGGQLLGNVITDDTGSGIDHDVDGDALYVLEINGDPNLVGVPINLASGATLQIEQDGSLQYDLNGQFHSLDAGQLANESISYTLADGWNVRMIRVTGNAIDTTTEAVAILAGTSGLGPVSIGGEMYNVVVYRNDIASEIDYGTGIHGTSDDDFEVNNKWPDGTADGGDDFLTAAAATWTIPAGTYTIALGSDDGGVLQLSNEIFDTVFNSDIVAGSNAIAFDAPRPHGVTGGSFTVSQPTVLTINAVAFDRILDSSFEISIATGTKTSFDGAVANGGSFHLLEEGTLGWSLTHAHASVDITVQGANDAPVINTAAGYTLTPIGDGDLNTPGSTVADILASVAGSPISDADTAVNQIGIAITGESSPNGTWQYSLNGGSTWTGLPSVSDDSALTLAPTAKVRFVPNLGQAGSASFTWRAWDQTTAANGYSGIDTTPAGGETAFSSTTAIASILVADNPQPPQLSPESYSILSNGSLTINTPGLLANDFDPDAPTPPAPIAGATLVYRAASDINGNSAWEDATNVSGFNWALPAGVSRIVNPASVLPGIQASYNFANAGGTTSSFSTLPGNPSDNAASFELWFKPVNDSDHDVLFETGGSGDGTSISLDGNTLKFVVRDTDVMVAETELTATINPLGFTQVVGTIDTTTGATQLFVNGVLVDSDINGDLHDWDGGNGAGLGKVNSAINISGATNYEGEIALFRFYESALSATQVEANYDSVATGLKLISAGVQAGSAGSLSALPDGSFTYAPDGGYDSLSASQQATAVVAYTVQDGSGLTATTTAAITVQGVDDAPVTQADDYQVTAGEELVVTAAVNGVLGNDSDPEGENLQATIETEPQHGTIELNADGTFTYTPDLGYFGVDEFYYVATTGDPGSPDSAPTRVVISVTLGSGGVGGDPGGGSSGGGEGGSGESEGGSGESEGGEQESSESNNETSQPSVDETSPGLGAPLGGTQPEPIQRDQQDATNGSSDDVGRGETQSESVAALQRVPNESASSYSETRDRLRAIAREVAQNVIEAAALPIGTSQFLTTAEFGLASTSSALWHDLEQLEDLVEQDIRFEYAEVASALGVTSTLSVGYVLWFLRGTYLVSCVLAQMPAWKMVDPLFVFGGGDILGDDDDESLAAMLQKSNEAEQGVVERGATTSELALPVDPIVMQSQE